MPVYEYECATHGLFEQLCSLAEYAQPAACPTCDVPAARVISAPQLSGMARSTRIAHERNEQSRHEPRHAQRGHMHTHAHAGGERPALKRYTGARPWVIEHG